MGRRCGAMTKRERLARDISEHKGQWVVIKGTQIVAADKDYKRAVAKVPEKDRGKVYTQYSSEENFSNTVFML
jgi:hypothetical protein